MDKQLLTALGWAVIFFIILGAFQYFSGLDDWLWETFNLIVPLSMGYILGYDTKLNKNK